MKGHSRFRLFIIEIRSEVLAAVAVTSAEPILATTN